jgi:hypothetical protein
VHCPSLHTGPVRYVSRCLATACPLTRLRAGSTWRAGTIVGVGPPTHTVSLIGLAARGFGQHRRAVRQLPHGNEDLHDRGTTRRNHSFRVPRPDLSVSIGTPNACNQCHRDRDVRWATDTLTEWFPKGRQTVPHFATALQAGRAGGAGAEHQLDKLILDRDQPGIARANSTLTANQARLFETGLPLKEGHPDW